MYKYYDEAGIVSYVPDPSVSNSKAYDFKGNILEKTRTVVGNTPILNAINAHSPNWEIPVFRVNWRPPNALITVSSLDLYADQFVDTQLIYRTSSSYDALNRKKKLFYPVDVEGSRKFAYYNYNSAGALQSVMIDDQIYAKHISYNAKGQRIFVAYGNGVITRYAYDDKTFRLARMRTEKYVNPAGSSTEIVYRPSGEIIQDFAYEYDLVGNMLKIHDEPPSSGILNSPLGRDALDRTFVYDPTYRLTSATGREFKFDFLQMPAPWSDNEFHDIDLTNARGYTQEYHYDSVGNLDHLNHSAIGVNGTLGGFSYRYDRDSASNKLKSLNTGTVSYDYTHDDSGNTIMEGSSRHFGWDHSNRMRVFMVQPTNAEPSIFAQYLYDSSGNRIKKIIRKQGGNNIESTVYIDEVFEHNKVSVANNVKENNELHIMDINRRIALSRVGNPLDENDHSPAIRYEINDHVGSSNVIVDNDGSFINREEYYPYGNTSFGSYINKRYKYSGKERDSENSLYYFGARFYAPWLARWMNCDTVEYYDGLSTYYFVHNNPVNFVDDKGNEGSWFKEKLDDFRRSRDCSSRGRICLWRRRGTWHCSSTSNPRDKHG